MNARFTVAVYGVVYVAIGLIQASYGSDIAVVPWLWPSVWIIAGSLTVCSAVWFGWWRLRLWSGAWLVLANLSRIVILAGSLLIGPLSVAPSTFQKASLTAILRDLLLALSVFDLWSRWIVPARQR